MKLHIFDSIPDKFFDVGPNNLHQIFPGPTLIRIRGATEPPLFLATLLHGDEPTGFLAVQKLLQKYQNGHDDLPRSLVIFFGNVGAATENIRHLRQQPDFNRIWNGGDQPEHLMAQEVINTLKKSGAFACIDIHNSSGKNPHHVIINKMEHVFVNLGRLFSKNIAYFTRPKEALQMAFSEICPTVTLESGQPNDPHGVEHVLEYLEKILRLKSIPENHPPEDDGMKLYHSMASIKVPRKCEVGFNGDSQGKDFCFIENLDSLNFTQLPENTLIGWRHSPDLNLIVINENGQDVMDEFITYNEKEILLRRPVVPSMLTTSPEMVYQDCLGYLMETQSLPE
jgi:succinylglutamate desuccinylase